MDLDSRVQVVTLDRNYGQSTAIIAGAEAAFGDWVATLDADGQNDPEDIPRMWEVISMRNCDGVTGVRGHRAGGYTIVELAVNHRPRIVGQSKYGINNRLWCGMADVLMVRRLLQRRIHYQTTEAPTAVRLGAWL